jgi:ribonuclease HI
MSQNILFKLSQLSSIYTAEFLAIFEALSTSSLFITHNNILILSDSMSAISAISNTNTKCKIAQCIQNKIRASNKTIKIMWFPSHIGIPGNEIADDLVSKAATLPHIRIY